MTDHEFDWATLNQVARVFRASRGLSPHGWSTLMHHASYAAGLATSLADGEDEDRERRDRLTSLAQAFIDVASAQTHEDKEERAEAWHEFEELLAEEGRWMIALGPR